MNRNAERGRVQLVAFKKAQRWAKKNPLPKKVINIISRMIADKQIYQVRKALIEAGYSDIVETLGITFGLFQSQGATTRNPLAPTFNGLVYPYLIIRCAHCKIELDRFNTTTCSIECQRAIQTKKVGPKIRKWRSRQTEQEKKQHQTNIEAANLKRFGVKNYSQSDEGRARIKERMSNLSKAEKLMIKNHREATLARNYGEGVKNPMDVPEIRKLQQVRVKAAYDERSSEIHLKKMNTMLEEYGVTHQIHLEETRRKIFKGKNILVGGKKFFCQGYESHVLNYLNARGWKLSVSTKGIKYQDNLGKERTYYPDLKAIKDGRRLLIEVKSNYTFNWTKFNQPRKFTAGTTYAQENNAEYIVCVVYPRKGIMTVLRNPKTKSDLKLKGQVISLDQ